MKRRLRVIFLGCLSICMFGPMSLYASHIIGGDIYYSLSHYNQDSTLVTYDIEFILYRDTAGLDFDNPAEFGVYVKQDDQDWQTYQVVDNIPLTQILEINALDDPCKDETLSQLIIESGIYNFQITLETGPFTYMVAHQRCCRNFSITNIQDPAQTGAVYDIIITPEAMKRTNNSPVFKENPPIFVCLGFDFDFDHGAIDVEGDSLVYKLCTPFISGVNPGNAPPICCNCVKPDHATCPPNFDEVIYTNGFTKDNPIGGDPQIRINSKTGRISGVPNILGSFVLGVCVDEFRDGVQIGSYRRDFEVNVETCRPLVYAELESVEVDYEVPGQEGFPVFIFESCEDEVDLVNLSIEQEFIDDYKWLVYDDSDDLVFSQQGIVYRDVRARLDGPGIYHGFMILNDQLSCVDTARFQIEIFDKADLAFDVSFDPCDPGPITFVNTSLEGDHPIDSWTWSVDGTTVSRDQDITILGNNPREYEVTLEAMDTEGCIERFTETIIYDRLDEEAEVEIQDTIICEGDTITFGGEVYWEEGSHNQFFSSLEGCDSLDRIWEVAVQDIPEVALASDDSIRIFLETPIELEVTGIIDQIRWTPPIGLSCDDCLDPTVILENDQTYMVEVTDDIGCIGVAQFDIFVDPGINFFVPNVLMTQAPINPVNEFFFLHVDPIYSFRYNLVIYDRWGGEIFRKNNITTNVADDGWSPGSYQPGVYVYHIEILGDVAQPVLTGDITVIR